MSGKRSGPRANIVHGLLRARDYQQRPEFTAVRDWYRDGPGGICVLVGIGGAGKTAIAERLLRVLPGLLPDDPGIPKDYGQASPDVAFVFSFYDDPKPQSLFFALAVALGFRYAGRASYSHLLAKLVNAPPMLLVLDGLERVQHDGARGTILGEVQDPNLRDLLVRFGEGLLPQHRMLVTTRFRPFDILRRP